MVYYSIYTSLYNLENGLFDWKGAVANFLAVADEVCIATSVHCKDNTIQILKEECQNNPKVAIVVTDIEFSDPAFDGKLKDAALKACQGKFCTLLDADERINPACRPAILAFCNGLENKGFDAVFLPVVNLAGQKTQYSSIGHKWYLHKNQSYLSRGVVGFAKVNNSDKWDVTKSDSCELIDGNGNLANSIYVMAPDDSDEDKLAAIKNFEIPTVFHISGLDSEKRKAQDEFWRPVWENRSYTGSAAAPNRDEPVKEHGLNVDWLL